MSAPTTAVRETAALCDDPAVRADRDAFKARAETLECERDSLREHLAATRTELAAVKAERDALNAAEADLRGALRAAAQAEQPCGCSASEVARLKAILECSASPYGVHRCCHCDSEVT